MRTTKALRHPRNHLPDTFYTMPGSAGTTMTRKQVSETMLATGGWIMSCGRGYSIKAKHLAAGVYSVTLEER
jgi:hypothetical protein